MCGIAGFVDPSVPAGAREESVGRMCAAMVHRGPDDAGMATRGAATLGMRRLAIFDPVNGHQPMVTPDGRFTLVFNGAIYNFRELQDDLEGQGWFFRTHCDTEVLLAALAVWGRPALARLRGMYAFALWDGADETLLLARDPFGIKPLYYTHYRDRLVFASEASALLASGTNAGEIDPRAVSEYLSFLAVPAPRTIYRGVRMLEAGETLLFRGGKAERAPTWAFPAGSAGAEVSATREDFVRGLRARLDDSIRAHVLADVPVGAFLSGGLDSAVVAGLMARVGGATLKTFSIGFEEDGFSEADDAEASAKFFGSVHHTRILTGDEVARDIDRIVDALDQPTGDGINTYYVSQTAQQGGVKAALSGLGGDELFGGYPLFRQVPALARRLPLWRRLPAPLRAAVAALVRTRGTRGRKLADILAHARDAHEVASLGRRVFPEATAAAILAADVRETLARQPPFHPQLENLRAQVPANDLFALVSAWELRTYMADVLLLDSDVMSMRHSLELRVPFIDRPLIEWLWAQPSRFKEDRRRPKSVLCEATADVLPPGLMNRRKRGFTFPFAIWMRTSLRPFLEDTFSAPSVARSGLFSVPAVQALWGGFMAGGENREWSRLWSLAMAIAFINRRQGSPPPAGVLAP